MRVIQIGSKAGEGETELADELRSWEEQYRISGVALVATLKPAKMDALVITPKGCTVIEVKGVRKDAAGRVDMPLQGAWTSEAGNLDLCLEDGAINPLSQVWRYVWDTKESLQTEFPGAFVSGLVVLVQHHNILNNRPQSHLLHSEPPIVDYDKDLSGIAATTLTRFHNNSSLRRYFHKQLEDGGTDWDIESVLRALEILGKVDSPSPEELRAEGFRPRAEVQNSVAHPNARKARRRPQPARRKATAPPPPEPGPSRTSAPTFPPSWELAPTRRPTGGAAGAAAAASSPTQPNPAPDRHCASSGGWSPAPERHRTAWLRQAGRWTKNIALAAFLCALVMGGIAVGQRAMSSADDTPSQTATATPTKTISTASRNIVCSTEGHGVRCDIDTVHYAVPSTPARCRKTPNWGHSFALSDTGSAHLECPSRRMTTTSTTSDRISVGQKVTFGSTVCTSRATALECVHGKHGFRIARASYRAW